MIQTANTYEIKRFDGETFGPFTSEWMAWDKAYGLLQDWMEFEDRLSFYRSDLGLHCVVTSCGEYTDASLVIAKGNAQ